MKQSIQCLSKLLLSLFALFAFTQCSNDTSEKDTKEQFVIVSQDSTGVVVQKKKKINKQNLVVKEWNTDVRTNTKVLDHITTWNAEGYKIEEIEYNSEGQKWRKRYEYDANGNKIQESTYDGHNRLVNVKKFEYNEFGKKKITYTYNHQGKLTAIKNYEYITQ